MNEDPIMMPDSYRAVEHHLDLFFGEDDGIVVFDEKVSPDFHLDVYWIPANQKRNYHILLTSGVGSIPMNTPDPSLNSRIELFILLPSDWPLEIEKLQDERNYWPIGLLKDLGRYPHTHKTWLGYGHTVPEGQGKTIAGTQFAATLLTKAATLSPEFQRVEFGDTCIDLLMLFPLYHEEYAFKRAAGIEALDARFDEKNISDIIDVKRCNACTAGEN
jgi:hypothetical protein